MAAGGGGGKEMRGQLGQGAAVRDNEHNSSVAGGANHLPVLFLGDEGTLLTSNVTLQGFFHILTL